MLSPINLAFVDSPPLESRQERGENDIYRTQYKQHPLAIFKLAIFSNFVAVVMEW